MHDTFVGVNGTALASHSPDTGGAWVADQAGIKVIPPYVEAQDAHGKWIRVVDDMGFPAGLARTMVTDLTGRLSPGTRRIRIVNNLKIYWDAIRIDQTPDAGVEAPTLSANAPAGVAPESFARHILSRGRPRVRVHVRQ